ncbi:peptidoglycan-binding domain-containing protein [Luteibacter sp. OK325]|uniref:peptidoglycan-binding domain-containing protein n=1 Tax=Luteibacter sp. OK325 TaxID=2135670 RepID=UPI001304CAE5|nr:peptidoglycan-binding domain-containing protein [Luteibacter sp. OK325]
MTRLVASQGMTRVYEMEDNTWVTAKDGTVSWRNNNPGNLKFEFEGSADQTVHSTRSKEKALATAQTRYHGVVDLDHWGNAVFENYEAGREAQKQLVVDRFADNTVEELVKGYSKADYSGVTHHTSQANTIYATAAAEGFDLHGKKVLDMTPDERSALIDGIARAEAWKPGNTNQSPPLTDEQLAGVLHSSSHQADPVHPRAASNVHREGDRGEAVGALQTDLAALGFTGRDGSPLQADQRFGPHTREALETFQQTHGLRTDGVAGPATLSALAEAKAQAQTSTQATVPDMLDARHPAHGIYVQAHSCVARIDEEHGRVPGPHTQALAGGLTSAAAMAGFNRIDHVALSDDANRAYAIQGELNSPFKQFVEVDVVQAIQTPLAQSSQEAVTHMQNNAQQQAQIPQQTQQQAPDPVQQAGPSMTR